jgi:hypothetical protein
VIGFLVYALTRQLPIVQNLMQGEMHLCEELIELPTRREVLRPWTYDSSDKSLA